MGMQTARSYLCLSNRRRGSRWSVAGRGFGGIPARRCPWFVALWHLFDALELHADCNTMFAALVDLSHLYVPLHAGRIPSHGHPLHALRRFDMDVAVHINTDSECDLFPRGALSFRGALNRAVAPTRAPFNSQGSVFSNDTFDHVVWRVWGVSRGPKNPNVRFVTTACAYQPMRDTTW